MRLGWKQGKKLTRITSVKATFSTRKFDEHGDWHWLGLLFRFIYASVFSKSSMDNFARKYWYGNQRGKSG
jgi:hypothetical protein